jgi:hypothetical protein
MADRVAKCRRGDIFRLVFIGYSSTGFPLEWVRVQKLQALKAAANP